MKMSSAVSAILHNHLKIDQMSFSRSMEVEEEEEGYHYRIRIIKVRIKVGKEVPKEVQVVRRNNNRICSMDRIFYGVEMEGMEVYR